MECTSCCGRPIMSELGGGKGGERVCKRDGAHCI